MAIPYGSKSTEDHDALQAAVNQYGVAETIRRLRDYEQLKNLVNGNTVDITPGSLTSRFFLEWEPKE